MRIAVCVKSVPETAEAELELTDSKDDIETDDLVFGINEWDNYAVEEALQLREKKGGTITVITIGDEEAEAVLRRAMAMGADEAIHLNDETFEGSDPATKSKLLAAALAEKELDLILTGVQSSDGGAGQVGVLLASALQWPHATLAVGIEAGEGELTVTRELEANTQERVAVRLPAVVTVQSGINQPRYVSIMGIRKVRKKPIEELEAEDLDFDEDEVGEEAAQFSNRLLSRPQLGGEVEMLSGSPDEVCRRAAQIIVEKGGLK